MPILSAKRASRALIEPDFEPNFRPGLNCAYLISFAFGSAYSLTARKLARHNPFTYIVWLAAALPVVGDSGRIALTGEWYAFVDLRTSR